MTEGRCVFTDDDVIVLQRAYAMACNALRFAIEFAPDSATANDVRYQVATGVIKSFKGGERRPLKIARLVLATMPPLQAHWRDEDSMRTGDEAAYKAMIVAREQSTSVGKALQRDLASIPATAPHVGSQA